MGALSLYGSLEVYWLFGDGSKNEKILSDVEILVSDFKRKIQSHKPSKQEHNKRAHERHSIKPATNLVSANLVLLLRSLLSSHVHGSSLRGQRRILAFIANSHGASTVRIDVMGSS